MSVSLQPNKMCFRAFLCQIFLHIIAAIKMRNIDVKNIIPSTIFNGLPQYDVISVENALQKLHSDDFQDIIGRCQRARLPLIFDIFNTERMNILLHSIPPHSSIPYHSYSNKLYGVIIDGETSVNDVDILSYEVEDANAMFRTEDAFAQGDDDCVCRGGMCPRRYGCVFWVEKKLRDENGYIVGNTKQERVLKTNDVYSYDTNQISPHQFVTRDSPAILLQILINDQYDELVNPTEIKTLQYFRVQNKVTNSQPVSSSIRHTEESSSIILYSTEEPLGYTPAHVPWLL